MRFSFRFNREQTRREGCTSVVWLQAGTVLAPTSVHYTFDFAHNVNTQSRQADGTALLPVTKEGMFYTVKSKQNYLKS